MEADFDTGSHIPRPASGISYVTLILLDNDMEKCRYQCHLDVLREHSQLLVSALESKSKTRWFQRGQDKGRVIKLEGTEKEAMDIIVQFINKSKSPTEICHKTERVARFAGKYNTPELAKRCALHFVAYFTQDFQRQEQLRLIDKYRNLDQLKAVCIAAFSTKISIDDLKDQISADLMTELRSERERRRLKTTNVDVTTYTATAWCTLLWAFSCQCVAVS